MFIKSNVLDKISGLIHGFGTLEEPIPRIFLEQNPGTEAAYQNRPNWKQVHGTSIAFVEKMGQECGEVDCLVSRHKNIPIPIVTADCVPILLSHREGQQVAAVHAGWRGTYSRILQKLWERLKTNGENPKHWVAAIGPAIGPCCYEVNDTLAGDFLREFSEFPASAIIPKSRYLDLPLIQFYELKKIGLEEIDIIRACTKCSSSPAFHSYRREGSGHRQWSIIMKTRE